MDEVYWSLDNETLIFDQLKLPQVFAAVESTKWLNGSVTPRVRFDLRYISQAFPAQVLPLVALCRDLHERGIETRIMLPNDPALKRLFLNANWAHLIAPTQHDIAPQAKDSPHLTATEYTSAESQQQIVNRTIELLLEEVRIDRALLGALEWCLNEITDNVLTHSGDPRGGVVTVSRFAGNVVLVVADSGKGIANTMRLSQPQLDDEPIEDDVALVLHALKPGVTSGPGQGNGLAGMRSIAQLATGEFTVISNNAIGKETFVDKEADVMWRRVFQGISFPGTVVSMQLPLRVDLDLRKALGFQAPDWEPFDYVDARYESHAGDGTFTIMLHEEHRGCGSRSAGRAMRNKALNMFASSKDSRLVVDFTGVPMIASSFADEFLGKLRAELGPDEFDQRVALTGFSGDVQTVIAGAVSQRMRTDRAD